MAANDEEMLTAILARETVPSIAALYQFTWDAIKKQEEEREEKWFLKKYEVTPLVYAGYKALRVKAKKTSMAFWSCEIAYVVAALVGSPLIVLFICWCYVKSLRKDLQGKVIMCTKGSTELRLWDKEYPKIPRDDYQI